jgi:hypothetical protein
LGSAKYSLRDVLFMDLPHFSECQNDESHHENGADEIEN